MQLISDISVQVTNIYRTQGDIDGLKAAKDSGEVTPPGPGASAKEQADYLDALRNTPQYEEAVKQNGIGSDSQKAVQAVTGVLTGLAGGNLQAAIAGGMNPYVAEQIRDYTGDNVAVNALAHAVWGGIAAEMAGNDATAGAVGAAGGELATRYIAEHYYGADTEEKRANLSEQDKQELSLLGTLAAGLAGGVAGDSTSSASAGAQAGKNAIDNNALSPDEEEKEHEHGALDIKLPTLDLGTGALRDEHGNPIPGTAGVGMGAVPIGGIGSIVAGNATGTGGYSNLTNSPTVGPGKNFTQTQKAKIYQQNMDSNGGVLRSDLDGQELVMPQKSQAGVTPPSNEAQIDHIVPRKPADPNITPGTNSYSNAQVLSREQNRKKSNKLGD